MITRSIILASRAAHNARVHRDYANPTARDIIRELRVKRGFRSDRALAMAAGIQQPALARYLAGDQETMELASFQALAKALDVTLSELLGEVPISNSGTARELVRIWEALPQPEQDALLAAGRAMANVSRR